MMQPSALDDFTELCHHENFNAYIMEPYYEIWSDVTKY